MSVGTTTRKTTLTMDAAITEYDFTFRALVGSPSDIKCILQTIATGVLQDMVYVADLPEEPTADDNLKYTVEINDDGIGGTVTVLQTPAENEKGDAYKITIYRDTTDKQESVYEDFNQFPAKTVESDFDRRTMLSQEIKEDIDRTLKVSITADIDQVTFPAPSAGKALVWNDDEDGVVNSDVAVKDMASYATTASTAAGEASASATSAAGSAAAASNSTTAAASHATTAATAVEGIDTSVTAASSHATTAGSHATTATTQATVAGSHATTAGSHSTTATTQATAAATSATTASSHATTAANAAQIVTINEKTTDYTLVLTDAGKLIDANSSGTITITVPSSGSVAFSTGTVIMVRQKGAGQAVIGTAATVAINTPETLKLRDQYSLAALVKADTDTWLITGRLENA